MQRVVVVGGGLAGMAAAARLAKAGHPVLLVEAADRLGGRWAPRRLADGSEADDAPAVIGFPAPWRDLFRKSGRTLEAELARIGCRLVPAAPATLRFADGTALSWPTDRGEQYAMLSRPYGERVAARWRALVDGLDDVWQAIRPLGLERELTGRHQLTKSVRALLQPRRTVADLALEAGHPHLTSLVRSVAYRMGSRPELTPAWCAVGLSVERRFGRWTVEGGGAGATGRPHTSDRTGRTSVLLEALAERLRTRRVEIRLGCEVARLRVVAGTVTGVTLAGGEVLDAAAVVAGVDPWQLVDRLLPRGTARRLRRDVHRLRPALAPVVHTTLGSERPSTVTETVELDDSGTPTITYARPIGDGCVVSVHDFAAARPDPSAGVAWRRFADWLRRPPVSGALPGLYLAGPHSAAGGGLSETVLAGALASYAVHDRLWTGG